MTSNHQGLSELTDVGALADATRLAEVESLLSTTADCLVLVTGGGPLPGQDGADARIVPARRNGRPRPGHAPARAARLAER